MLFQFFAFSVWLVDSEHVISHEGRIILRASATTAEDAALWLQTIQSGITAAEAKESAEEEPTRAPGYVPHGDCGPWVGVLGDCRRRECRRGAPRGRGRAAPEALGGPCEEPCFDATERPDGRVLSTPREEGPGPFHLPAVSPDAQRESGASASDAAFAFVSVGFAP
eukprot:scaffold7676_cov258-Pinguiococcus_pyrenoidosus.AAC.7